MARNDAQRAVARPRPGPLRTRCSPPRCATSAARLSQGAERFLARRLRRPGQSEWAAEGTSLPTWHFGQKNRKRPTAGWSSSQFATGGSRTPPPHCAAGVESGSDSLEAPRASPLVPTLPYRLANRALNCTLYAIHIWNGHNCARTMLPPTTPMRLRPFGNSRTGGSCPACFVVCWTAVFRARVHILFPMQHVK